MTILLDTEGAVIPGDDYDNSPLFDTTLCDWKDGKGPSLSMNIPELFETHFGIYDSQGVIHAPLQAILEEYLLEFKVTDGGDGIAEFCKWLRDYADRLESAKKELDK